MPDKFEQLHLMALNCFKHSYAHKRPDPDNCGACALTDLRQDSPNYAGWARVYVEAQRPIPVKWVDAFFKECFRQDNRAYTKALADSIRHFKVRFEER